MIRSKNKAIALLASLVLGLLMIATPVAAQEQPNVVVGIYHVAPGKHLDFLRWQAAREAAATQIGLGATQWYAHLSGDSWDYISIGPESTPEQDDKADAILQKQGLKIGMKASLEFRTMVNSHTDTLARGPATAAALVDAATK